MSGLHYDVTGCGGYTNNTYAESGGFSNHVILNDARRQRLCNCNGNMTYVKTPGLWPFANQSISLQPL